MDTQMLRKDMELLRRKDLLKTCPIAVDSKYELGAVLRHFENQVPILFTNVKGHRMPLLGGLFGNRDIYYYLLGTSGEERIHRIMRAITEGVAPRLLPDGPVRENFIVRSIDLKKLFPIPISHEKDSAPFLTSAMVIVKDSATGMTNMAVRRMQVNEGNILSVYVSPASPLVREELKKSDDNSQEVECAVVLGYDAEFLLASQVGARYGLDKYYVDGGLRGEPLELVKCKTIDLAVPAQAEIVLEGVIPPHKREMEGPFGELMSYYGEVSSHPVMEVRAVMHRNDAIFHHAFPCREEHLCNGLIREAELYAALKNTVDVQDVNVTAGGGYRLHAVVSIKKSNAGDGMSAILAALGSNKDLKHVVIVDEDVNIFDPKDVEFALATRVQASRDVVVVPGALGSALEASHLYQKTTDKVGIDATRPLGEGSELFERVKIPGYDVIRDIDRYFS